MAHAQHGQPAQLPATLWDINRSIALSPEWIPENVFSRANRKVPAPEACPLRVTSSKESSCMTVIFPEKITPKHPTWTLSNWLDQRWFLVPDDRAKVSSLSSGSSLGPSLSREWTFIIAYYSRIVEYDQVIPELWAIAAVLDKYWPHYGMTTKSCAAHEISAIVDELHAPIPRMPVTSAIADSPEDLIMSSSPIVRKIGLLRKFVDTLIAPLLEEVKKLQERADNKSKQP